MSPLRRAGWSWECKWADLWIGVFWKRKSGPGWSVLHIWICLVPCFPIHVWVARSDKER